MPHYCPKHGNNRQQSNITMTDICAPWEHIRWFNNEFCRSASVGIEKTIQGYLPSAEAMAAGAPSTACSASHFPTYWPNVHLSPLLLLAQGVLRSLEPCPHAIVKPEVPENHHLYPVLHHSSGGLTEHLVPTAPQVPQGDPVPTCRA